MAVVRTRRRRRWSRWLAVALLSLLGHAALLGALLVLGALAPPRPPPPQAVTIRPLDAAEWERRRGAPPPPLAMPRPSPGQVVDVAPGNGEVDPAARFLAETSNRVERETRARVQSLKPGAARSARPRPPPPPPPTTPAQVAATQPPPRPSPDPEPAPASTVAAVTPEARPQQPQTPPQPPRPPEQEAALAGAGGASPGDAPGEAGAFADLLRDLPEGDATSLNTQESAHAAWANRMKRAVAAQWHPRQVMAEHRRFLDPVNRVSVVAVTIDRRGVVREARLERACGFSPLDDEAVAAVRRARAFPDPPQAWFEDGETFSFPFAFHLDAQWPSYSRYRERDPLRP